MKKNKTFAFSLLLALFCGAALLLFSCASAPEEKPDERENATTATEEKDAVAEIKLIESIMEEDIASYSFAERLLSLLEAGDFKGALAAFDELEEPDSLNPALLKLKLSILVSSGDMKAATALADSLEGEYGEDTDILYARAVIALAENRTIDRNRLLRKIIELEPANTDAMLALGDDSLGKKAYGDAARWYSQALATDSANADAHRGLAHSYYLQGRMQDARAAADRALAMYPDNAALLAESALIHAEEKNLPAALNDLRRAVSLAPDEAAYWSNYGALLVRASKLSEARDALSEAIRLAPDNIFPYLYRCGVNDTLGFEDEAIADYRFVCRNFPQYYYAAEGLGVLLWIRGDFEGAKSAFAQAFKYDEDNLSYALMYTLCCYKLGQKDEAKRFIGRFMSTLEDRSSAEYFLCRLFFDLSGDSDVVRRISSLKDAMQKSKLMFYVAVYYELFQSESLAAKVYGDIASEQMPASFEYRLASVAAERATSRAGISRSPEGAR